MESESTPREYVVLPSRVLSIPIGLWPLESVVHASYKYYLAWLLSISMKLRMPMPRRGISVSVTMHVNSGCPHQTLLPCLTLYMGCGGRRCGDTAWRVTIRTATALPEKEGVEIDSNRMVVYGRQALPPWTDNQSPTCLCNGCRW